MIHKILKALYLSLLGAVPGGLFFSFAGLLAIWSVHGFAASLRNVFAVWAITSTILWWISFPGFVAWQFPNMSTRSTAILGGILGATGFWVWMVGIHAAVVSTVGRWGGGIWDYAIVATLATLSIGALSSYVGQRFHSEQIQWSTDVDSHAFRTRVLSVVLGPDMQPFLEPPDTHLERTLINRLDIVEDKTTKENIERVTKHWEWKIARIKAIPDTPHKNSVRFLDFLRNWSPEEWYYDVRVQTANHQYWMILNRNLSIVCLLAYAPYHNPTPNHLRWWIPKNGMEKVREFLRRRLAHR